MSRSPVSVIVPFAGSLDALEALLKTVATLELEPADELIVADNRRRPARPEAPRIRVLDASGRATPAHARNRGASAASGEWLVFLDADVLPLPGLLHAYFEPPPERRTAVLAGAIRDVAPSTPHTSRGRLPLATRHSLARGQMAQSTTMGRGRWAYAQTANCAVRREAFEQVGGFADDARAGEDADLCFRLAAQGWRIEERPRAEVEHLARSTLLRLVRQLAVHGSGAGWVQRRHPGAFPAPGALALSRRLAADGHRALRELRRGEREAVALAALDMLATMAFELGRLLPNRRRGARKAR